MVLALFLILSFLSKVLQLNFATSIFWLFFQHELQFLKVEKQETQSTMNTKYSMWMVPITSLSALFQLEFCGNNFSGGRGDERKRRSSFGVFGCNSFLVLLFLMEACGRLNFAKKKLIWSWLVSNACSIRKINCFRILVKIETLKILVYVVIFQSQTLNEMNDQGHPKLQICTPLCRKYLKQHQYHYWVDLYQKFGRLVHQCQERFNGFLEHVG